MICDQFLWVNKIADEIKITEAKPPLVNQQRVVYKDKCESETNGGKTWSRGTNSLLPFVAKVTLNLARARGLLRPLAAGPGCSNSG